jgi:RNA-binding protein YhbY
MNEMKFQIGKNGVTAGTIESLKLAFKTHKQVRVSVLKGAVRDKEKVREMAEQIASSLDGNFKCRIIGFTIIMRKSPKPGLRKTKPKE